VARNRSTLNPDSQAQRFHAVVRSPISLLTISGEMNAGRIVARRVRKARKSIVRRERIHLAVPTTEKREA
jgi:hypothetical protein